MNPFELVRALRAKGLTQKEIEARTGISQPTVSKIERGEITDVMSRYYRTLLAAYEEVMSGEGREESKEGEKAAGAAPGRSSGAPAPEQGVSAPRSRSGPGGAGTKVVKDTKPVRRR